jgi:hypothetical protein
MLATVSRANEDPAGDWQCRARRVVGVTVGILFLLVAAWQLWVRLPAEPNAALVGQLHAMAARPCSWLEIVGARGHGDPPGEIGTQLTGSNVQRGHGRQHGHVLRALLGEPDPREAASTGVTRPHDRTDSGDDDRDLSSGLPKSWLRHKPLSGAKIRP